MSTAIAPRPCFDITAKGSTVEILIYDRIGRGIFEDGVTAQSFSQQLKAAGKPSLINVRINSPGGAVFEATAIFNALKEHSARVVTHVDGSALSAASLVAMAGDEIRMAGNALMMIHDPMAVADGRADDMRRAAEILDKARENIIGIYADRTKQTREQIAAWMAAESWMNAEEAKQRGFADTITGSLRVHANFSGQSVPVRFAGLVNGPVSTKQRVRSFNPNSVSKERPMSQHSPNQSTNEDDANLHALFVNEIDNLVQTRKMSRREAVVAAAKIMPEAHRGYLRHMNPQQAHLVA